MKPDHNIVQYHNENMHEQFMEKELVATQPQILRCLLVSKKLREAWSLLGIQKETKDSKVNQNVFENIANAIKLLENPEIKILVLHVE